MVSNKAVHKFSNLNKNFTRKALILTPEIKEEILKEIRLKKFFNSLTISCLLNVKHSLVLHVIEELLLEKKIIIIQYSSKEKFYIILNLITN